MPATRSSTLLLFFLFLFLFLPSYFGRLLFFGRGGAQGLGETRCPWKINWPLLSIDGPGVVSCSLLNAQSALNFSPPPSTRFHPSAPLSSNNQPSLRRRTHHDEWRHVLLGLISAKQDFESSWPVIQRVRRIRAITLARGIASFAAECRFQLSVFVLFFPIFCCGTRTWKVASDLLIDVRTWGEFE